MVEDDEIAAELIEAKIPFLVLTGYAREALPAIFKGARFCRSSTPTLVDAVLSEIGRS